MLGGKGECVKSARNSFLFLEHVSILCQYQSAQTQQAAIHNTFILLSSMRDNDSIQK